MTPDKIIFSVYSHDDYLIGTTETLCGAYKIASKGTDKGFVDIKLGPELVARLPSDEVVAISVLNVTPDN